MPHRPIIKDEAQSTFKIRPVFNCSLKTRKDKPSLNETSYQGVNIMQNMLHLLLKFRTNSKVLLGDLEKAFLQIRHKLLRIIKDEGNHNSYLYRMYKVSQKKIRMHECYFTKNR